MGHHGSRFKPSVNHVEGLPVNETINATMARLLASKPCKAVK